MLDAEARERVIVALDCDREEALSLADALSGHAKWLKVGMTLYYAEGPSIVREFKERGFKVFLDLKFHDIPHQVRGAARSAAGAVPCLKRRARALRRRLRRWVPSAPSSSLSQCSRAWTRLLWMRLGSPARLRMKPLVLRRSQRGAASMALCARRARLPKRSPSRRRARSRKPPGHRSSHHGGPESRSVVRGNRRRACARRIEIVF